MTPADPPLAPEAHRPRATRPGCAVAGGESFCMDGEGAVHRRRLDGTGADSVVAHALPGGPLAAEAFDGGHVVLAYTAPHKTTEGVVTEAYATLDGAPPVHLSDEGSGATHLSLARRGNAILALLLDGRAAMTPVHARPLTLADGKLAVGDDAVVYVAGGAETSTRATVGTSGSGAAFALLPIARDMAFGMESVRLDEPPRVDEPSTWSVYPNGLDPAPVAATRGTTPIRVARVRPLEARPDSPRVLELGSLDDAGAFSSYGMVPSHGRVRDVALTADPSGAVWLAFTDAAGSWLSLRACP